LRRDAALGGDEYVVGTDRRSSRSKMGPYGAGLRRIPGIERKHFYFVVEEPIKDAHVRPRAFAVHGAEAQFEQRDDRKREAAPGKPLRFKPPLKSGRSRVQEADDNVRIKAEHRRLSIKRDVIV
jgi:hypothetical protein